MNSNKLYILFFLFGILLLPQHSFAQEDENEADPEQLEEEVNKDDLGNVTDKFQEYFFYALAQRGIENYEKAITALEKCKTLQPNNIAVFYELGKNHKSLEEYGRAEDYLQKALKAKTENRDILTELYDVYYLTNNYPKAIDIAQQLSKFNLDYYEDLANLYARTEEYKKALQSLDYIDERDGQSDYRDALRSKIFSETTDKSLEEDYLKEQLSKHPKDTNSYLALMYFYAKQDQLPKTYEISERLLEVYPNSKEAHYSLYKSYLANYEDDKAVNSMKTVLESDLSETMKKEVIKDFVQLVNQKPKYQKDLLEALDKQLEEGGNRELANYYMGKDNTKAIFNLEAALKENPSDYTTAKDLMLLYLDENMPEKTVALAEEFMVIYPSQPLLYLITGVAQNTQANYKKAEEALLMGIDFLIDDPLMESDYYRQLIFAYKEMGNTSEAEKFQQKLEKLLKTFN